jgi:hypothetical protein
MQPSAAGYTLSVRATRETTPPEMNWLDNAGIQELTKRIEQNPQATYSIKVDHKKVNFHSPKSGSGFIDGKIFKDLCDVLVSKSVKIDEFVFPYMYSEHIEEFAHVLERCNVGKVVIGILSDASMGSLTKFFGALNKLNADIYLSVCVTGNDRLIQGNSYKYIQHQTQHSMLNPRFALGEFFLAVPHPDEYC